MFRHRRARGARVADAKKSGAVVIFFGFASALARKRFGRRSADDDVRARFKESNEIAGKFVDACEKASVSSDGDVGEAFERFREFYEERKKALS